MAKWDFKIVGASFVKELAPVGDDVNPRSQSFMQPSFDLEGDKIVMKESGQYKTAIGFTQIGEIDGVAPTDLQDAYDKLLVLVENFNGGGGAPGTTPNLTQVVGQGDLLIGNSGIGSNTFLTLQLGVELTENYFNTSGVGTGGIFLDKDIIFPDNSTIRFQAGFAEDGGGSVTLDSYKFTTDAHVYYQGAEVTDITIQPDDVCMLKYAGLGGDGAQVWLLTVTNKESIGVARTGTTIMFDTGAVYNSIASPETGNFTADLTGARIRVVQKIYHNSGTAPTFPGTWVLRGTGAYVTSTLNIIYAEWSVGTTVEYWITQ